MPLLFRNLFTILYFRKKKFLELYELAYELVKYANLAFPSLASLIFEGFTHSSRCKVKCSKHVSFIDKLRLNRMFQAICFVF